jgi:protein O-mannosyl-transferase
MPRKPPEPRTPAAGPDGWRTPLACSLIVAGALLAYRNSLGGPFVWDDPQSIADNPTIRHLWPVWSALRPPHGGGITVEGRPILNLTLALNYAISGTAVWSYHAVNILIHILAGLALFGIARRTLQMTWPAFAVAILWTVHPLQTESVTYVVQRAESLMGLFYLLTLYCLIRYASAGPADAKDGAGGSPAWAALSFLACLLGMGTKEVMASAPVVVFLYDRTFLAGSFRAAWRARWRFYLALASSWALLAALVASGGGNRSGTVGFGAASWSAYLLTQFPAVIRYLRLVIWPHPLVFDYATFWISDPTQVLPEALLVSALFACTLWALRFRPAAGFLGACFFLILAPTSLVPGTSQMIVEHRMYLPLAAVLSLIVCAGLAAAGARRVLFASAIAAAGVLAVVTFRRNSDYATALALWSDNVARSPGNPVARDMLGLALRDTGRTAEAISQFEEAVRIKPGYAEARNNLGIALEETGRPAEAITQFREALRIKPAYAEAHNDLGLALQELGRVPEAITQFEEALQLAPEDARVLFNLGCALRQDGRTEEAITRLREAIRIKPAFVEAHDNLGLALQGVGIVPEAIAQFQEALRLAPGDPAVHFNLGCALREAGQTGEAIAEFQRALRIKPAFAEAHNNLGVAFRETGRPDEAIAQFRDAIRFKPAFAEADNNLGIALGAAGQVAEAIESFQRALLASPGNGEIHLNLAVALRAAGREMEAQAQFQEAARLRAGAAQPR